MGRDSAEPLFRFDKATIARYLSGDAGFALQGTEPIVTDLNWSLASGQNWAIVGPSGSGKTTLAETLLGRHRLRAGELTWPRLERQSQELGKPIWPSEVLAMVGFREDSRLFSYRELYYQQRFEFAEEANAPTVAAFLTFGHQAGEKAIAAIAEKLHIAHLLEQTFLTLSNGETRRARIGRALLQKPELLMLDDPLVGLDVASRADLERILGQLIEGGAAILLLTGPKSVPSWITHVLELRPGTMPVQEPADSWRKIGAALSANGAANDASSGQSPVPYVPASPTMPRGSSAPEVIGLENVTVKMGTRVILDNVSWTVRQGERWALSGPNGSGKTTLLSLLCGDHPQAYCNTVRLFGKQRGTGETIWEIKQRVGLVSPELHLYFSEPLSAWDTAATGFFDVLTRRTVSAEQAAIIDELFEDFGLTAYKNRPLAQLSTGQQRLVFFIRALVKQPPLLLLDEPFQALDRASLEQARRYLDEKLKPEQTLVFVTHVSEDLPACVTRKIRLEMGKVVEVI